MNEMNQQRRRILTLGTAVFVSGCTEIDTRFSGQETTRPTTRGTTSTTAGQTDTRTQTETEAQESPANGCEEPTPRPVPDVKIGNELEKTVSVEITIRIVSETAEEVVHESTQTLEPGGRSDLYDVLSEMGTYRFDVELDNGTTATTEIETESDRYSIVSIRIEEGYSIEIDRLNIHPPPTPTTCP